MNDAGRGKGGLLRTVAAYTVGAAGAPGAW
jgi:hypothetical protein